MDMQPIRVLEVFGKMNRGGAETMIMNIYRNIDKTKIQMDFMVHTDEHCQYDDEINQLGGRIYHVPRFNGFNCLKYISSWLKFFQEHPEHSIVHGHMGATAAIYLFEANKMNRYTIAHSHTSIQPLTLWHITYRLFSWPTRFIAKYFMGCSTEAGLARFGKKIVRSRYYTNFHNAICIQNYIYSIDIRKRKRNELNIHESQQVIIHVGRIVPPKNPLMILNVFKEIVKQDNNAICLWVGTGELETAYKKIIISEGLQERILMLGMRTDIPELLMAADSFLFPSLWEGLPVSVIEAQASGLPCVISDTISKEVEITSLIEWHNLQEDPKQWANRCLTLAKKNRTKRMSPIYDIRKAGYDIVDTTNWLTNFYLSIVENK
jgi:glycosyltransferase involved in cell wall biosynthesis